jgi:hypothetical protein
VKRFSSADTKGYVLKPVTPEARTALKAGENLIAVHCNQISGGQFIDVGLVEFKTTRIVEGIQPVTPRLADGSWIDLLPLVDPSKHAVRGSWRKIGSDVIAPAGFGQNAGPEGVVRTPWTTPDIWMRRDFTMSDMPPGGLQLLMDHDNGVEVYLNGVLASKGSSEWTEGRYRLFSINSTALRAVKPGRNVLAVHCNQRGGPQYIDVGLVTHEVQKVLDQKGAAPIDLAPPVWPSHESPAQTTNVQEKEDAGAWTDILPYVDPAKHTFKGSWWRTDNGLTQDGAWADIGIPVVADGDFDLRVEFTRLAGVYDVRVRFPIGTSRHNHLYLSAFSAGRHGFAFIDGQDVFRGPARVSPGWLMNGHPYTAEIQVRNNGQTATLSAKLEGEPLLTWKGPLTSLSQRNGAPTSFALSRFVDQTVFHAARLRVLSGEARVLGERREIMPTSQKEPANWKYTLDQPDPQWLASDFNDPSWPTGPAGFGAQEKPEPGRVLRTPWKTKDIWLRRDFTLPSRPVGPLAMQIFHDEGVEVYVNGVQAAKATGSNGAYQLYFLSPEAQAALRQGKNALAAHCTNAGGAQYVDVGLVEHEVVRTMKP